MFRDDFVGLVKFFLCKFSGIIRMTELAIRQRSTYSKKLIFV